LHGSGKKLLKDTLGEKLNFGKEKYKKDEIIWL